MELIDKEKVCKEIKRLIDNTTSERGDDVSDSYQKTGAYFVLNKLLHYIDTLEVKEVDLQSEVTKWLRNNENVIHMEFARHFFNLGLKAKEGKE